jgi:hypothetical protein
MACCGKSRMTRKNTNANGKIAFNQGLHDPRKEVALAALA